MDQQTEKTAEPSPKKTSIVDTFGETLTVQTAKALVVAKSALEVVARWLDARAKDAGELATKLSSPTPEQPPAEASTEPSA